MSDNSLSNGKEGHKYSFELKENCCNANFGIVNNNNNNNNINNNNLIYNDENDDCNASYKIPSSAKINLEFEDVRFTVRKWSLKSTHPEIKEILKGVSGRFRAKKLTAIMGPSGAGKSTLLNVLAAYKLRGFSGSIRVNNKERNENDLKEFKTFSCYIQQEDYLRLQLKVYEAMNYTADLKLGSSVSKEAKKKQVKELLKMLGLLHCWNTPTNGLSGGQKKRLSVALELISNPSIIFLDEPTTGLDSSSCSQCISLLKMLAQQGRTVICTIHQPSALIFEMFDNLYALAAGECIYSGPVKNLIEYLGKMNLICPKYYNPADFLLDVANGEYEADINVLAAAAKSTFKEDKKHASSVPESSMDFFGRLDNCEKVGDDREDHVNSQALKIIPASFPKQFWLLYCRTLLMIKRKPSNVIVRAVAHVIIALLFGYIYRDVGSEATTVLANYCYLYGSNLFVVYTGKMSVTLLFPIELSIVSREHFNSWYKLGPYYLSMMLIEIPFQIICCYLYLPLSYYLTGQPQEWNRFLYFSIIATTSSLAAQAFGFLLGIAMPKKIAVFLGPIFACLLSVFGFCLRFVDTPQFFKWLYYISYFRASFQSSVYSVYGLNRTTLNCDDLYCHFKDPKKFLSEMDMPEIHMELNLALILSWFLILHVLTVIVVWYKLNRK